MIGDLSLLDLNDSQSSHFASSPKRSRRSLSSKLSQKQSSQFNENNKENDEYHYSGNNKLNAQGVRGTSSKSSSRSAVCKEYSNNAQKGASRHSLYGKTSKNTRAHAATTLLRPALVPLDDSVSSLTTAMSLDDSILLNEDMGGGLLSEDDLEKLMNDEYIE